jgi:exopolysaccharide biosynthesis protein/Tol biopolymer transport system component
MTMRKPLLAMLLACALAAGLLVPGAAAQPLSNGNIAFASGRGGELFEIWAVEEDGTAPRRLIAGPPGSVEVDPAFDPTGTRVVFSRKAADDETYDLMVGNVAPPVNAIKLTEDFVMALNDRQAAWSTGGEVAFTRSIRAEDTTHIYKVPAAGGTPVQLTGTPAPGFDAGPAWNPTATQIAFVSDRTGFPQLFTMNGDGTGQVAVTAETSCFVSNPAWLDVTSLVFEKLCPGSPTGSDIFTLNLVTGVQTPLVLEAGHDHQPAVAPEGDEIVFTRIEGDGDKDLYTIPVTGGPAAPIGGNAPQADLAPTWGAAPSTGSAARVEAVSAPASDGAARPQIEEPDRRPRKKRGQGRSDIPRTIIKGVRYREMRRQGSDVYVLKISPPRVPRLDVSLSNDLLPGHERTSRMAKRHRAVAAINGDFGTPSGRPSHTFAEDGDLKQVSFAVAPTFAMSQDEKQATFARPTESVLAIENDDWLVDRWNFGQPGFLDVAAFTPAAGSLEVPPANSCSVRLVPSSGRRWGPGLQSVETDYTVAAVGCSPTAMPVNGGVVLSARPGSDGAILIGSLTVGERVTLRWSIGFPGVLDTVGGIPLLVENGAVVATACPQSICKRHPRTGIGVTPTGRILMVVVDGRRKGSKGMTLVQFAGLMRDLHASFALNLDGGGSSTMWVDPKGRRLKGRIVNRPSDGSERKVSSAVVVIKGVDPGEAVGAPIGRLPAGPAPPPARDQAGERAVLDPASTGGLLEAMAEGSFGPPVDLPKPLRRALREFRSSR